MRYFLITLLVCLTAFAAVFNGPAWSQYNNGSCEQADSTAANLECINRHYQIMQDKLKTVFKKAGGQDEAAGPLLGAAQKDWLVYRDSQCKWEAELPKVPALKRVYELSCLTALTEKRIAVLQAAVKHEQADKPREFGAQPRWMNALAHDYPKTFWRYGEWKSADMDCDGEDDAIMTGIDVAQVAEEATGDGKDSGDETRAEIAVVVAISDNPPAGRPKARLLKIPVGGKGGAGPRLCRPAVRLEVTDKVSPGQNPGDNKPFCIKSLHVSDGICPTLTIDWDGTDYKIQAVKAGKETL